MRSLDRSARFRGLVLATAAGVVLLPLTPAQAAGTAAQRTWNFDQVSVPAARAPGNAGADVLVAVLDSWIDPAHKDFEGRVLAGADCVGGTCKPGPPKQDACDHGTHVAGTVASSSFGVAPRVKILPVRVLMYNPGTKLCIGTPDDVAAGIRWAVRNKARIINLSLG
ncbi:MAG: S8 family serine peptidase, partial [Mycobacteriales bacterium]